MHGPGGVGRPILSQSEDQSRPHPVLTFVHAMSTQVRCLGLNAAESAHRSDPRIATRTRKRISGQAADYPENWIKLFGCVSRGRDRRLHQLDPRQKTPQTTFPGIDIGCHPGLRAPRSPGFPQPVCSTPRPGDRAPGGLLLPQSASLHSRYTDQRVHEQVDILCRSVRQAAGARGGSARRPGRDSRGPTATDRDGLALTRLRRPSPGGICRRALPVGSCGARVLYRSGY